MSWCIEERKKGGRERGRKKGGGKMEEGSKEGGREREEGREDGEKERRWRVNLNTYWVIVWR